VLALAFGVVVFLVVVAFLGAVVALAAVFFGAAVFFAEAGDLEVVVFFGKHVSECTGKRSMHETMWIHTLGTAGFAAAGLVAAGLVAAAGFVAGSFFASFTGPEVPMEELSTDDSTSNRFLDQIEDTARRPKHHESKSEEFEMNEMLNSKMNTV